MVTSPQSLTSTPQGKMHDLTELNGDGVEWGVCDDDENVLQLHYGDG